MARQSTYNLKTADEIVARLSEGEPLRQICRSPGMPAWRTVYDWLRENQDFAARFAHARDLGFDAIAEECIEIAEDGSNDWIKSNKPESGEYLLNGEHVQRSKLRIETRLKLLAKWSPKKYGDKQHIEHSGKVGLEALVAPDE